ncbi:MAG: HDIG domain-containing protein [Candidatus Altiarchaeota archaeon]|nr:HDIG domain-containing protein [Candidatus Altiarchaeota archaeon]
MDYDAALRLLETYFGDNHIARHCKATERKAVEIAEKIKANGIEIDVKLVRTGALLHDIGRCKTHKIEHNYEGAKMLRELGFEKLARAVERHGANIFADIHHSEMTLEEKVIFIADKYTEEDRHVTLDERFKSVIERRRRHGKLEEIPQIEKAREVTERIERDVRKLMGLD